MKTRTFLAAIGLMAAAFAPSAWAAGQGATFLIVHGIPGREVAAGLDPLLPVDVQVNGSLCLKAGLNFGDIAGPYTVPAGTYSVTVSLANPIAPCTNSAVISASLALADGEYGAVVAALSRKGTPTAELVPFDVSPVGAGSQRVVVANATSTPLVRFAGASVGGSSGTEKFTATVTAKDRTDSFFVFTRPGWSITATGAGADYPTINVPLGDRALLAIFAVGSAKSGSATLLTKTLPFVN